MQTSEIITIVYTNAIDSVILDLQTKAVKMKTASVIKALSKFRNWEHKGNVFFQSRSNLNRVIQVVDQNGSVIALPLQIDQDGNQTVAFHAKTVKSLVEFLENKAG